MRVTVRIIDGVPAIIGPGLLALHGKVDLDSRLIVLSCPECGQQTVRYLVDGETFEVRHATDCALAEALRAFLATHPELEEPDCVT